jgi:hypothetical protein
MTDDIGQLSEGINRLIEEGYLKPGERRPCISIILRDLEEADQVVDSAMTKATLESKN